MRNFFPRHLLYRLRNEIPLHDVLGHLSIPCKHREGYLRFLCPVCSDFNTAVNTRTNLGRCFRCQRNFNAIELVMSEKKLRFLAAVQFLEPLLLTS